jgi:hypothetical protein
MAIRFLGAAQNGLDMHLHPKPHHVRVRSAPHTSAPSSAAPRRSPGSVKAWARESQTGVSPRCRRARHGLATTLGGRSQRRIVEQLINPGQLLGQHQQFWRQDRLPQPGLITYSSHHDGLDPF